MIDYLNKVFFKDSRNMTELPDDSVHLIVTSPPYFNIKDYSLAKKLPVVYEKCPCAVSSLRIKVRAFMQNKPEETKEKIINNFLKILPNLKKQLHEQKIIYCEICSEPSRNEICKKCELLSLNKINA